MNRTPWSRESHSSRQPWSTAPSATPFGFAGLGKILSRLRAAAGYRFQFEQRQARCRDQSLLFLRGNFFPLAVAFAAFARHLRRQCLMIVMEELCQPFRGYLVNPHTVPLHEPAALLGPAFWPHELLDT